MCSLFFIKLICFSIPQLLILPFPEIIAVILHDSDLTRRGHEVGKHIILTGQPDVSPKQKYVVVHIRHRYGFHFAHLVDCSKVQYKEQHEADNGYSEPYKVVQWFTASVG
jgi:hypothetical protein